MNGSANSSSGSDRKWFRWTFAVPAVILVLGLGWVLFKLTTRPAAAAVGGKFTAVQPVDFDIKVVKDGELQAVENIEIQNKVEGITTIVYLVKEGAHVKKGDLLVELDSANLRDKILDAKLEKQNAESNLQSANEMMEIQKAQNEADLEAARVEVELSKLALKEYSEGKYPQAIHDAETAVKMARITVNNKQQDLDQTKGLYAKGFVTGQDVKSAELNLTTVQNELKKAETALTVLKEYTHQMEEAKLQSALLQAEKLQARQRRRNASLLAQALAEVKVKEQTLETKTEALKKLEDQLANCKIHAPTDGMVVYAVNDRDWSGSGQIQEQAQVRERQRLLKLPDLSRMKVVLKVNETQVTRLQTGQRALVRMNGVPDAVPATLTKISQVADSSARYYNPDLREYPVELELSYTPAGLKPGMSAQAEIYTDRLDDVLAVPMAAIYSDRTGSYVFVQEGGQVVPVKVEVGRANETHVQIVKGLSSGQNALLLAPGQGRDILEKIRGPIDDNLPRTEDSALAMKDEKNPGR
jgi:HlyD family secretion protein